MPKLPIVFDSHKGDIIAHFKEEKKRLAKVEEEKSEEEKKAEKVKGQRSDLFELLSKQDEKVLDLFAPEQDTKKKALRSLPDIEDICNAIVLSKMSLDAQSMSYKVNKLDDKNLIGEEMLEYYKAPYAVYCNKSYFILIRQALEDHMVKLKQGSITTVKQSNVLNLIKIYQANIDCARVCRINLREILPENEVNLINVFQYR